MTENNKPIKPLLAKDVDESKLKFPLWGFCKIDGCWLGVQNGKAFARSLKPHENKCITEFYSNPDFEGVRGEFIAGTIPNREGLVRESSSFASTIDKVGEPGKDFSLWAFDYVTEETKDLPYKDRYGILVEKVENLRTKYGDAINVVQGSVLFDLPHYLAYIEKCLSSGYEGVILRDYNLPHKEGRSSSVKTHLWRYKPYKDAEFLITGIIEGNTNTNEKEVNELGRTKRSFAQDGLVPNGLVGGIAGTLLEDLTDCMGKVIMQKGSEVLVSPGEMTAKDRKYYFENQGEILGKIAKFKYFAFDLKDKPRYPTFITFRSKEDL